jgi:hypothetical protein
MRLHRFRSIRVGNRLRVSSLSPVKLFPGITSGVSRSSPEPHSALFDVHKYIGKCAPARFCTFRFLGRRSRPGKGLRARSLTGAERPDLSEVWCIEMTDFPRFPAIRCTQVHRGDDFSVIFVTSVFLSTSR